jgi:alcohol dehydrogenase
MSVPGVPFAAPTRIYHGAGSVDGVAAALRDAGILRPAIVSDRGVQDAGVLDVVTSVLESRDRVWADVRESPTSASIEAAAAFVADAECDGVIAVGGGSCIDTGKAAAVLATHGGPLSNWYGANRVPGGCMPVVAIPTTAGSGSECNWHVSVLDEEAATKRTIRSLHCCPSAAILDPDLLATLPAAQAAASGIDALAHALEAFTSAEADPLSDALMLAAMQLMGRNLVRFIEDRSDTPAGHGQALAAALAGIGVCQARTGLVHAMARPAVGHLRIPHGVCVGLLLPAVAEFNLPACESKYRASARALGLGDDAEALVSWLAELRAAHLESALAGLERSGEFAGAVAAEAVEDPGACERNPRKPSLGDVIDLYRTAFGVDDTSRQEEQWLTRP